MSILAEPSLFQYEVQVFNSEPDKTRIEVKVNGHTLIVIPAVLQREITFETSSLLPCCTVCEFNYFYIWHCKC